MILAYHSEAVCHGFSSVCLINLKYVASIIQNIAANL